MRYYHLPPHQHQIIYPYPRPLPPTRCLLPTRTPYAELSADLSAAVEEYPDWVALFDAAYAAGDVGAVVEDEGDEDFGGFDCFLEEEEFFAELLAGLGFAEECRFGHYFRGECDRGVGAKTTLWERVVAVGRG